jgi:hypothetical protein
VTEGEVDALFTQLSLDRAGNLAIVDDSGVG